MRRSVTEVIRRGFENCAANWPLILIRIGEAVLFMVVLFAAVVAAVIPMAMSIGLNRIDLRDTENVGELVIAILLEHWPVLLYLLALMTVVLMVLVAIHSFVEAGSARVYVDAERAVASLPLPQRAQFRVFTAERWMQGGRRSWWPVFLIYNLAWTFSATILLIPLILLGAVMLLLRATPAGVAIAGCLGLVLFLFFAIVVGVVTNVWCQKAIVVVAARGAHASAALRLAWREFTADAGRHIAVALIMFAIIIAGSGVFSMFSMAGGLNDSAAYAIMMMPLQILGSILNSIFSAAVSALFLACLAALTMDPAR